MFSNKTYRIVVASLVLAALAGGTVATGSVGASKDDVTALDRAVIKDKVHVKKIKELQGDHQALSMYLSQLSTKDLLETAAELADSGEFALDQQGIIIIPELKKRWENKVPREVEQMIKDKTKSKKFRLFLMDSYSGIVKGDEVHDEAVLDSLLSVALDKTENGEIRSYALLKIRKPSKNPEKKKLHETKLKELFNDLNTPASVRGAVVTAMKRSGNPYLQETVEEVMLNTGKYPSIVVRHAIAEGAKSGKFKDIVKMKDLANKTQDPEVYATTVNSLGLLQTQEAVKAIVEIAGKHNNPEIAGYALMQNQAKILEMLALSQGKDTMLAGIAAVELIQLHSAVEKLEAIVTSTPDAKIRSKAQQVLAVIKATPQLGVPSNAHKWEGRR